MKRKRISQPVSDSSLPSLDRPAKRRKLSRGIPQHAFPLQSITTPISFLRFLCEILESPSTVYPEFHQSDRLIRLSLPDCLTNRMLMDCAVEVDPVVRVKNFESLKNELASRALEHLRTVGIVDEHFVPNVSFWEQLKRVEVVVEDQLRFVAVPDPVPLAVRGQFECESEGVRCWFTSIVFLPSSCREGVESERGSSLRLGILSSRPYAYDSFSHFPGFWNGRQGSFQLVRGVDPLYLSSTEFVNALAFHRFYLTAVRGLTRLGDEFQDERNYIFVPALWDDGDQAASIDLRVVSFAASFATGAHGGEASEIEEGDIVISDSVVYRTLRKRRVRAGSKKGKNRTWAAWLQKEHGFVPASEEAIVAILMLAPCSLSVSPHSRPVVEKFDRSWNADVSEVHIPIWKCIRFSGFSDALLKDFSLCESVGSYLEHNLRILEFAARFQLPVQHIHDVVRTCERKNDRDAVENSGKMFLSGILAILLESRAGCVDERFIAAHLDFLRGAFLAGTEGCSFSVSLCLVPRRPPGFVQQPVLMTHPQLERSFDVAVAVISLFQNGWNRLKEFLRCAGFPKWIDSPLLRFQLAKQDVLYRSHSLPDAERLLGYSFGNRSLLVAALKHRTIPRISPTLRRLGDAVWLLVITRAGFEGRPWNDVVQTKRRIHHEMGTSRKKKSEEFMLTRGLQDYIVQPEQAIVDFIKNIHSKNTPALISVIFRRLVGSVFIDSRGNIGAVERVFRQ